MTLNQPHPTAPLHGVAGGALVHQSLQNLSGGAQGNNLHENIEDAWE